LDIFIWRFFFFAEFLAEVGFVVWQITESFLFCKSIGCFQVPLHQSKQLYVQKDWKNGDHNFFLYVTVIVINSDIEATVFVMTISYFYQSFKPSRNFRNSNLLNLLVGLATLQIGQHQWNLSVNWYCRHQRRKVFKSRK
jgi:hypothetical protein